MPRRVRVIMRLVAVCGLVALSVAGFVGPAAAQDTDAIVTDLENQGWYIEPGADGDPAEFDRLVSRTRSRSDGPWYFVSLAGAVGGDYADVLRDETRPTGNVLLFYWDNDDFSQAQLATGSTEEVEFDALASINDPGWSTIPEFMQLVVDDFGRLDAASAAPTPSPSTNSGTTSGSSNSSSDDSGGGGAGWLWIGVPVVVVGGGIWYASRRSRKQAEQRRLDAAEELRTAIQAEVDELANDVIVLAGPVDLSDKEDAITHYREATATYTAISDELPDMAELANADLDDLRDLGARVAHARWQMDAAEAILDGEPVPEKPEVEPPPAPTPPPTAKAPVERRSAPPVISRAPRPRTRSTGSRRRGGGLLDILIGGAAATAGSRSRGRSRAPTRSSRSAPRPGGGVFGGGSSGRSGSRRSTSRSGRRRSSSGSRSRSRASSSRRSTSRSGRRRR